MSETRGATAKPSRGAEPTALETLLARDRFVVLVALTGVIVAAWTWLLVGAGMDMDTSMPPHGVSEHSGEADLNHGIAVRGAAAHAMTPAPWTPGYALMMFCMWWVMMLGMMLPGAAPVLLLFARVNRKEKAGGRPYVPTAIFAAGYLTVWAGFSAIATGLQGGLQQLGFMSPAMTTTSMWLGGFILLAAGLWQLTPVKDVCLRHCRSPLGFLAESWRSGRRGAFRMGLHHGAYCLGCCWFLMGLLFFGGIMNLYWIAGLALYVLLEKTVPMSRWLARGTGLALAVWGVAVLAAAAA